MMLYPDLFAAVLLSFVIERLLAVFFDITGTGNTVKITGEKFKNTNYFGASFKGVIAAAIAIYIAQTADLNIIDEILKNTPSYTEDNINKTFGQIITGIFIAGGSQASVKLFQDVMGFSKANRDHIKAAQKEETSARTAKAKKEQMHSKLEIQRAENALAIAEGEQKITALKAGTDLQIAEIERSKNLADARTSAGTTVEPKFLTQPSDIYLRDAIDNWDEFVQLRAELLAR